MKEITLSCGRITRIDDEDFDYLNQFKWHIIGDIKKFGYAARSVIKDGIKKSVRMHREIMKVYDANIFIDHADHDTLNNQKYNLRKCTRAENQRNRIKNTEATSKYLGVNKAINIKRVFSKKQQKPIVYRYVKWEAKIQVNRKQIRLGYFLTENEAVLAYNKAAKEYFGEFANLNIIPTTPLLNTY